MLQAFGLFINANVYFTRPDAPAAFDGVYTSNDKIVAFAEAKIRVKHTLSDLHARGGTYLITAQKVKQLAMVADAAYVPAFLVVRLADGTAWFWKITDGNKSHLHYTVEATRTQASSVDATTVVRENAFLKLSDAVMWAQFSDPVPSSTRVLSHYTVATEMMSIDAE